MAAVISTSPVQAQKEEEEEKKKEDAPEFNAYNDLVFELDAEEKVETIIFGKGHDDTVPKHMRHRKLTLEEAKPHMLKWCADADDDYVGSAFCHMTVWTTMRILFLSSVEDYPMTHKREFKSIFNNPDLHLEYSSETE